MSKGNIIVGEDVIATIGVDRVKKMSLQELLSNTENVVLDDSDEYKNICEALDIKRVKTTDEIYNHYIKNE